MKKYLLFFLMLFSVSLFAQESVDQSTGFLLKLIEMFPWLGSVLMYAGGFALLCWLSDIIINDKYDKGWFKKYVLKYILALPVLKYIISLSFKIPVVGFLLKALFDFLVKFSPENTSE